MAGCVRMTAVRAASPILKELKNFRRDRPSGLRLFRRTCYQARNVDPANTRFTIYCDTHAVIKELEARGFSLEQAEGIMEALIKIVNNTLDYQGKTMVTKPQQEIMMQQLMAAITAVKKDMIILEKSEFSALRNETEKQTRDIVLLKERLNEEISKLKGLITLDINLERGHSKENFAENEKKLSALHNRIDTEVANLRTMFERNRNDVLKYAGGTVLSCFTICLGFYRLWS